MTKKFLLLNSYVYLVEHKRIWLLCLHLFCFGGKSVVVLFFCDFLRKEYFISYHFFLNSFQCWRLYSRWYSTPSFCGWNYIENLAASTGKTEKPTEQLLHGANKVQPRKETLSKCKVHIRKLDCNDSSYNSYEVSDRFLHVKGRVTFFIYNLRRICFLILKFHAEIPEFL